MKTRILHVLAFLRIVRQHDVDSIERWEDVSKQAIQGSDDIDERNRRDIPLFLNSGLDMETINATLFDGAARRTA